ncbi:MAG: hypothetical protein IT435_19175 [Phycisphaerales bacterium]|nr:hypothetical protein [Phycisphaerales bacterium]
MTGIQTAILIACFILFDSMVVCAIIHAIVDGCFGHLARRCPPAVPLTPGAPYREFQDMKFGMSNFGKCIHIGVDESGVHLFPTRFLRWFRAKHVTIPWTQVELEPDTKNRKLVKCRLAGSKASLPAWCFDAIPEASDR